MEMIKYHLKRDDYVGAGMIVVVIILISPVLLPLYLLGRIAKLIIK